MLKTIALFLGSIAAAATSDANLVIEEKLSNILDKNDLLLQK